MLKANGEEKELERLRAENRYLRSLLAKQEASQEVFAAAEQGVAQPSEVAPIQEDLEPSRLFDTILSSIVDFVYVLNMECRILYANQALLDLWQLSLRDAIGKNFFDLNYPHELATRLHNQIQTVFATGKVLRDETPYTGRAGTGGYYEYIFVPVFGKSNQVEFVAGSTRDITQRYLAQAENETLLNTLEVERARLRSLFMQAPAFITVLRGPHHIFEMANPHYFQLVGHRELIGKPVREAFPDVEGQGFFEILDRVYQTGQPFIGNGMRILFQAEADPEPQEHFIDFVYQPLVEANGSVSGIFVHGVDLTERKRAEESLAERAHEVEALNLRLKRSMTETHHRVKNNLQVISAMIEMQMLEHRAEKAVPIEEFAQLKAHVHTLSIVHDLLTKSVKEEEDAQRVSAKAVLDTLLPMLRQTGWHQRVYYRVEEAQLTSKQCISLALILNELVTNALKHGKREAEVVFGVTGAEAILEVTDDGPGFPDRFSPLEASHMGLELVESLILTDLQGHSRYENRPEGGGRVMVSFPLPPSEEEP